MTRCLMRLLCMIFGHGPLAPVSTMMDSESRWMDYNECTLCGKRWEANA